jgi:hypothetical protein
MMIEREALARRPCAGTGSIIKIPHAWHSQQHLPEVLQIDELALLGEELAP